MPMNPFKNGDAARGFTDTTVSQDPVPNADLNFFPGLNLNAKAKAKPEGKPATKPAAKGKPETKPKAKISFPGTPKGKPVAKPEGKPKPAAKPTAKGTSTNADHDTTANPQPRDNGPWALGIPPVQNPHAEPAPTFDGVTQVEDLTDVYGNPIEGVPGSSDLGIDDGEPFEVDSRNRPKITPPGGDKQKSIMRATSVLKPLETGSSFALNRWLDRELLKGLIRYPQLADKVDAELIGTTDENVVLKELDNVAYNARQASGGYRNSDVSKQVKQLAEDVDRGMLTDSELLPAHAAPFVDELVSRIHTPSDELGGEVTINPATVGVWVYIPERRGSDRKIIRSATVGRIDRVATTEVGELPLMVNTSKSMTYSWKQMALNLALLSQATAYLGHDGNWHDLELSQDVGVIVHTPVTAGAEEITSAMYTIDLSVARRALDAGEVFLAADKKLTERNLASGKATGSAAGGLDSVMDAAGHRGGAESDGDIDDLMDIYDSIDGASSVEELRDLWEDSWPNEAVKYGLDKARELMD